jgi:hypothetical protein
MGLCGGSKHQKRAARSEAAKAKTVAGDGQPCPLGKCHLRVTVARADTGEGVGSISVESKGPTAGNKPTAKESGLADFGVVNPGQYTLSVKLSEADKKKYQAPGPLSLTIAKGDTKAQRIVLAPLNKLRFVLIDGAEKVIAGADWNLSKPAKNGKTAASGLIEVDLPWDSDDDRELKVKLPAPAAAPAPAPAAPAPAVAPDPYPPHVEPNQFHDEAADPLAPELDVDWKLSLADLPDGDNADGVKARLNNLGFNIDDDEKTKRAVKAYQKVYLKQDNGSGIAKDILDDIKTRHDKAP